MITLVATLRLRGNWWKLLAVWTYLYPQEVTLLLHLVALLLLTALLLLAALLAALPPLLLPHTTPPLHHTSPSPCVWLFRSETASTLLCWCNRTSKSEGSGSLTTAGSTWGLVGRVRQDLEQANGLGLCGSRNPRQLAAKRPAGGSWV